MGWHGRGVRVGFVGKVAATAGLVGLGDLFFYGGGLVGAPLGLFALVWAGALAATRPELHRIRPARAALVVAVLFAFVLVNAPGLIGWSLFWVALTSAALLPRSSFVDAIDWGRRLLLHGLLGFAAPVRDLIAVQRCWRSDNRRSATAILGLAALPALGSATFVSLFALANPVIAAALGSVTLPDGATLFWHGLLCGAIVLAVWPSLRPHRTATRPARDKSAPQPAFRLPTATLVLSLAAFNAVFAVENGLDLAFLWSGAPLPAGVTLATYAHQGAYPLIGTALLAGLIVLVGLAPGSEGARSPAVRRLVVLWVGQNLLLVASAMLRTLDYIAAYSLTGLRIAALAWMGLVAVGLLLICWRLLTGRSAAWLVNRNALAGGLTLALASVVDLGATAATWNAAHARTARDLDLCYFERLGPSALLPLLGLEHRATGPKLHDQIVYLRIEAMGTLAADQTDWHRWTWAGARRLRTAKRLLGHDLAVPGPAPFGRDCEGAPFAPPAPAPLTTGARP